MNLQPSVILSISPKTESVPDGYWSVDYEGYEIVTENGTFFVGIEDRQMCCEQYGYFAVDDTRAFVGATLTDARIVYNNTFDKVSIHEMFRKKDVPEPYYNPKCVSSDCDDDYSDKYLDVAFVDIETSLGVLQFVAYNMQNGFYGHDVIVHYCANNSGQTIAKLGI